MVASYQLSNTVVEVKPDHLEAKLRLANVLEDMGQKTEALELVSEGELKHLV
jgi:hypothetical protein